MSLLLSNLFSPDNTPGTGATVPNTDTGPTGKEDIIEFLKEGDDDEPILELPTKKKEDKTSDKKEKDDKTGRKEDKDDQDTDDEVSDEITEEVDELQELEDELNPPTEEQLELVTPVRRREILKKYPELFKDFPYLEKAYYREQQFTELLPTIDDARAAVKKAETLDNFEKELIGDGNTENILKAIKTENPEAFAKLADDYLPTLARVDERAYMHVLANISKHTIAAMVQEARRSNNQALQSAAQILNQFVFGSSEFTPPSKLASDTPEKQESKKAENSREQQIIRQTFENTLTDLNSKVNNTLKNTIDAHIDPRGNMSEYIKKNAARDALDTLQTLISNDSRFKQLGDKLWEKCIEANFSKESVDRIKSAYLAKAKSLLPAVIKKARSEALRGTGKKVKDEDENPPNKGPITPERPRSQQSSGKVKSAKDIPRGMSSLEFLNSD